MGQRIGIAAGLLLSLSAGASGAVETAKWTEAFIESMGVNTHYGNAIFVGGNAYADPAINAKLGALGVRHIRDHSYNDTAPPIIDSLYGAYGIKTNLILGETTRTPVQVKDLIKAHIGYEAVEGLNEPDLTNRTYNGVTDDRVNNDFSATRAFQNDLYAAVKGDPATNGITVLSPAMSRSNRAFALVPISLDVAAMHNYAWASPTTRANEPSFGVDTALSDMSTLRGSKPLWATETGYYNQLPTNTKSVPENISGKYVPRAYAEYFNRGIARTYIYELADQGPDTTAREQNFGLLRYDMTEKPAYTAVKNLIDILEEPAAPTSGTGDALNYALTLNGAGDLSKVHHTLLQKSDDRFYLLLWQEVLSYDSINHVEITNAAMSLTLSTSPAMETVRIFSPGASSSAMSIFSNTSSVGLSVTDQMMVVEMTMTPEPGMMLGAIGVGMMAMRRRYKVVGGR